MKQVSSRISSARLASGPDVESVSFWPMMSTLQHTILRVGWYLRHGRFWLMHQGVSVMAQHVRKTQVSSRISSAPLASGPEVESVSFWPMMSTLPHKHSRRRQHYSWHASCEGNIAVNGRMKRPHAFCKGLASGPEVESVSFWPMMSTLQHTSVKIGCYLRHQR